MHLLFEQRASYFSNMSRYQLAVDGKNEAEPRSHNSKALASNSGPTTGNKAESRPSYFLSL